MIPSRRSLVAALCLSSLAAPALLVAQGSAARRPSAAHQPAAGDLLDRAVAAFAKVKTVRATFDQVIVNSLTGTSQHATGTFVQRRPRRLAVAFDAPFEDRIVADGTHLWLYLPSSTPGQVIRSAQTAAGAGALDLSAQFLSAPRARYDVSDAGVLPVGGASARGYTLVPKAGVTAAFTKATVYVGDDAQVKQFVVTERNGVQRTVRLTSYRTNVPVDAKAFTFAAPAGVTVVER